MSNCGVYHVSNCGVYHVSNCEDFTPSIQYIRSALIFLKHTSSPKVKSFLYRSTERNEEETARLETGPCKAGKTLRNVKTYRSSRG